MFTFLMFWFLCGVSAYIGSIGMLNAAAWKKYPRVYRYSLDMLVAAVISCIFFVIPILFPVAWYLNGKGKYGWSLKNLSK